MKKILAFVALSFLASTAFADVTAIKLTDPVKLSAGQKTKLSTAVLGAFPAAKAANVVRFYCRRTFQDAETPNEVLCSIDFTDTVTEAVFVDLDTAGRGGPITDVSGGNVTFMQTEQPVAADATEKTKITEFVTGAFPGVSLAVMVDFACLKNGADIFCKAAHTVTLTPHDYALARQAGTLVAPGTKVP